MPRTWTPRFPPGIGAPFDGALPVEHLRALAEYFRKVPAGRQVERQFGELERFALGTARCLSTVTRPVKRVTAMLEREREDGLVGVLRSRPPAWCGDLGVADLRRARSSERPLPSRYWRVEASTTQGWSPIRPLISTGR